MQSDHNTTNNKEIYYELSYYITDFFIAIASIVFIFSFSRIRQKNYGVYMILILAISDLLFPIMSACLVILPNTQDQIVYALASLTAGVYEFGLLWSTNIAIFVYVIYLYKKPFNPRLFLIHSFLCCLAVSLFDSALIYFQAFGTHVVNFNNGLFSIKYPTDTLFNKIMYVLIGDVFAKLIPMIITSVCYYKVYCLAKNEKNIGYLSPGRIIFYPLIQIICFAPGVFADIVYIFIIPDAAHPFAVGITINTLHRCWGFLSLMAYWFVKPNEQEEQQRLLKEKEASFNSISLTLNTDL